MSDLDLVTNNVLPFKAKNKTESNRKEIMRNEDVKEFFKFVYENDLRIAALDAIKNRLDKN